MAGPIPKRRQKRGKAASASVFTSDQLGELRELLRDKCDQLLPILERAVRRHKSGGVRSLRDEARAHFKAAKKLERASGRFLDAIEAAFPLGHEAQVYGFKLGDSSVPAKIPPGSTLGDVVGLGRWWTLDQSRSSVESLLEQTCEWRDRSQLLAAGKKGRPVKRKRRRLTEWVVAQMVLVGIRPTTYVPNKAYPDLRPGKTDRTLRVVYEAAGEKAPKNLFREIQRAIQTLRKVAPDLMSAVDEPLQKRASKKSD